MASRSVTEVAAVSCDVKYHGFVYVNGGEGIVPGIDKVKEAYSLLRKPKKAQKAHPLFARGFSEANLTLRCAEQGIKIAVKDALGATTVLMNHPIFKIAFVCNQGKSVLFIAKRRMDSTSDQFKCHGFECTSTKTAKRLAKHMVMTCNSVFRKLRRTRKIVRKKTIADGGKAAEVTPAAGPCESEADRMRRELQAEVDAAKEYRLTLQAALADLDACEDDADGNDERGSEVDMDMVIAYEEYADEFAQISLELAAQAATSSDRRVLNLFGEGEVEETEDSTDLPDDVEDGNGFGESDEYMATRSNSI